MGWFIFPLCYNHHMISEAIGLTYEQIETFCREHNIRSLAFFGSVVRDDFGPDSDIDVLVEFEPGHVPGYGFFLIEAELCRLTGRKIDLQTVNFLNPEIRHSALSEAVTVYEQA
jgi:predicted nucleotidyltransferase